MLSRDADGGKFCVCIQRHLSRLHPFHQLIRAGSLQVGRRESDSFTRCIPVLVSLLFKV